MFFSTGSCARDIIEVGAGGEEGRIGAGLAGLQGGVVLESLGGGLGLGLGGGLSIQGLEG